MTEVTYPPLEVPRPVSNGAWINSRNQRQKSQEPKMVDHRKDTGIAKVVIGGFLALLLMGVAYLFFTQTGVVPGDSAIDEREGVPVVAPQ